MGVLTYVCEICACSHQRMLTRIVGEPTQCMHLHLFYLRRRVDPFQRAVVVTCPSVHMCGINPANPRLPTAPTPPPRGPGHNPVVPYPRNCLTPREEMDSSAFRSFLVVKNKTSRSSAEAGFSKFKDVVGRLEMKGERSLKYISQKKHLLYSKYAK